MYLVEQLITPWVEIGQVQMNIVPKLANYLQIIYMFKGSKKKHLDHYSFFYLGPQVIYILKDSKKNHLNDFFLVLFWGLALLGLHALITNLLSNKLFSCIPFLLECITFNGSNQKVSQFHFFPI